MATAAIKMDTEIKALQINQIINFIILNIEKNWA